MNGRLGDDTIPINRIPNSTSRNTLKQRKGWSHWFNFGLDTGYIFWLLNNCLQMRVNDVFKSTLWNEDHFAHFDYLNWYSPSYNAWKWVLTSRNYTYFNFVQVPIYRGSNSSLVITPNVTAYFGEDGLGDNDEPLTGLVPAQTQRAVQALLELSKEHAGTLHAWQLHLLTSMHLVYLMSNHNEMNVR